MDEHLKQALAFCDCLTGTVDKENMLPFVYIKVDS